jgi:hypothetical protein
MRKSKTHAKRVLAILKREITPSRMNKWDKLNRANQAKVRTALRGHKYVEANYGAKGTSWEKAHVLKLRGHKVFVHFHPARLEDYAIGGEWVNAIDLKNIKARRSK